MTIKQVETMMKFEFKRTMQYTEEVILEAKTLEEAWELAKEADGERNHDDTVVSMEIVN